MLNPPVGDGVFATAEVGQAIDGQVTGVAAASSVVPLFLDVTGLPELFLYVNPTTLPLGGVTFTPVAQFAMSPGLQATWEPLTAPIGLAVGVPVYFRDRIPGATGAGIQINLPGGFGTIYTMRMIVGAGG